jgi:hypothetical protein
MIICYMGTPGSGKSYEAALRIIENLKKGRKVYAYLEGLELTECREIIRVYTGLYGNLDDKLIYVAPDDLTSFYNNADAGSFIIIDECHKYFSNREWATPKNKNFSEWCSTHRHVGCDVLLITQHLDKLDSHIRTMIEWTYKFRKVNFFGGLVQKKYMEYVYSQDDVVGECLSRKTKTYDRKIFPVYKSYANQAIKEVSVMKGTNIFKHPIFYALGVIVVVICVLVARSDTVRGDLFGGKKIALKKTEGSKSASFVQDASAAGLGPLGKIESDKLMKAEPGKAEPGKAEPRKAEPGKAEPGKAEPRKAEPGKAEPGKAEPGKANVIGEIVPIRTRPLTVVTVKKGQSGLVSLKCIGNECTIENPSGKL